jgi:hypothetical protein
MSLALVLLAPTVAWGLCALRARRRRRAAVEAFLRSLAATPAPSSRW